MKNILEEMYYGDAQSKLTGYKKYPRYEKALSVVNENEEILTNLLNGNERNLFLGFANAYSELLGITSEHTFVDAFKLGARVMIEVASDNE